jgi:hypothetical protein
VKKEGRQRVIRLLAAYVVAPRADDWRTIGRQPLGTPSAIFTVKEIADRLPPGFVRFGRSLAFVGVDAALGDCVSLFGGAALWLSVGETRFIRFQLELFRADSADFDRKHHSVHDMTLTS